MKFMIPMIVGAAIGYATNWLAIKMLFRPYYEKRFMGIKIPFTPGLIPKEKLRISKNIGETVGEYLLSPKTLAETLSSEKTNKQIKLWIGKKTEKIKDSGNSARHLLINIFGEKYNDIIEKVVGTTSNFLVNKVRNQKTQDKIMEFIKSKLYDDEIYGYIKVNLEKVLHKSLESKELELLINSKLENEFNNFSKDERIIKDVLSEKVKFELDNFLNENIETIGNHIRDIVNSPDIQRKLKQSISNMVDQNVSRLITNFINSESISEKIYSAIIKYINDESSNEDILLIIQSSINKIMESKISELTSVVSNKINPNYLSKYILDYLNKEDNQKQIVKILDARIKAINRDKIILDLSEKLDIILNSEKISMEISLLVYSGIDKLLDKNINDILNIFKDNSSKIYSFIKLIFDKFIKEELPEIIKLLNVSKIVEDEINKFDVEFTEKLILDIAQKELKAITLLGALIGGIMGLLSPLMQML